MSPVEVAANIKPALVYEFLLFTEAAVVRRQVHVEPFFNQAEWDIMLTFQDVGCIEIKGMVL